MTQISKNFTLEECCVSSKAKELNIKNVPDAASSARLKEAVTNMLQPIRDIYNKGITINSGYRCPAVNKAVGGAATSQHTTGYAFDIKPAKNGDMDCLKRFVLIWARSHNYDQIIFEQPNAVGVPAWIHIGWKHTTKGQRRQILVAKKTSGKWVYNVYKG